MTVCRCLTLYHMCFFFYSYTCCAFSEVEVDDEGDIIMVDAEQAENNLLPCPPPAHTPPQTPPNINVAPVRKRKRKRHRYGVKYKLKVLRMIDRIWGVVHEVVPKGNIYSNKMRALEEIGYLTGIPLSTLEKWTLPMQRAAIEEDVLRVMQDRKAKEMKVMWSPKLCRPWFPRAEATLNKEIRDARAKHLRFSYTKARKRFKELAEHEDAEKAGRCKFSNHMMSRFFVRKQLAVRKPSCVKPKPLEEAVKEVRGFLQWMREDLLCDKGGFALLPLDKQFGRFTLDCRINKDEVPMHFGSINKTISVKGEKSTQVSYLSGWGSRIGTLVLAATASGYLLDVVLIFKGNKDASTTASKTERKGYEKDDEYAGVHVVFQPKAWIDTATERFVIRKQLFTYADKVQEQHGGDGEVEFLLQHDSAPGHFDHSNMQLAKEKNILMVRPPPNLTNYIQLIDANIGKLFRNDVCDRIDQKVDAMMDDSADVHQFKLKAGERRRLVAVCVAETLKHWREDAGRKETIAKAARHTGLAMTVGGIAPDLIPQRFPDDFAESVCDSSHPMYNNTKEFKWNGSGENEMPAEERDVEDMDDGWEEDEVDNVWMEEEVMVDEDVEEYLQEPEHERPTRRQRNRGCLDGCPCTDAEVRRHVRCDCTKKGGCGLQCKCGDQCKLQEGSLVRQPSLNYIDIDTAVRMEEEGEYIVKKILEKVGDKFKVRWDDGSETWEPIENFIDRDEDGSQIRVNEMAEPFLRTQQSVEEPSVVVSPQRSVHLHNVQNITFSAPVTNVTIHSSSSE